MRRVFNYLLSLIHRNVSGYIGLGSNLLQNLFVILASHELVHELVAPLDYFIDLLDLFLFGLFIENFFVLVLFRPLYGVVQGAVGSGFLDWRLV